MSFTTSALCDKYGSTIVVAEGSLLEYYGKHKVFSGPIVTVKVYEDIGLVKKLIETAEKGSVVVVHGSGSRRSALVGKELVEAAVMRGVSGIIIYGCIRDIALINEMDIGILAIGTNPILSVNEGKGEQDIPVHFAGVDWVPNHYTYIDRDGILVSKDKLI
ncbi:ribonuclease E activity regulator RraA [Halalkalibacter urbisdiaboli]|uniref:ribonuclease E activity regulator RraA n=1 Tax=Halalkalibacter urbisdiaboli TaxID=1960589 RepID=UPI000B4385C4|nr:ribonuclease E activity regulator RraA [Halalkalibacter urbisdiaboli]